MANELQAMSDAILARPEMNHRFAERLAILSKEMREDEARHGNTGRALGAADLPYPVKRAMQAASRVMTRTAYWI